MKYSVNVNQIEPQGVNINVIVEAKNMVEALAKAGPELTATLERSGLSVTNPSKAKSPTKG